MRALALKPRQKDSLEIIDVPKPVIGPTEVLISTLSVGIDGTDIEINKGSYGEAPAGEITLIPGHEAVGKVVAAEKDNSLLKPGDIVVPTVRRNCRECPSCRQNKPDMCQSGDYQERGIKKAHGYLSEFFKESPDNLVKLPPELASVGPLIEPMSIAEKALEQAENIQKSLGRHANRILVLGAGTLGLLATIILAAKDRRTYVFDKAGAGESKAQIAGRIGADYLEADQVDLTGFADTIGPPDLIIEATGNSSVALKGTEILDERGVMCLLSVTSGKHTQEFCLDCFNNRLVLGNRVIFGSVSSNRSHFKSAIESAQAAEARWPGILGALITQRLDLVDYKEGFFPKEGEHIKSIINF